MEERPAILVVLLFCIVNNIHGTTSPGNALNKDQDYLDYIASKRHEIENALLSRQMERDLYGDRDYLNQGFDYDDEEEDRSRRFDEEDGGDERSESEVEDDSNNALEEKRLKRLKKIEKLKKESNNLNSPNHMIQDEKKSKDHRSTKKRKPVKKKKKKRDPNVKTVKNVKKKKDQLHHNEADPIKGHLPNLQEKSPKLHEKAGQKIDEVENEESEKSKEEKADQSKKEHSVNYPEKEAVYLDAAKGSKPAASNKSIASSAPRVVPKPQQIANTPRKSNLKLDKALFIVVVAACSVAGVAGLILASYCWYRLRKENVDPPETEYEKRSSTKKERPPDLTDDEKLAKSAEVYHYMHAKKQLAAMESPGRQKKANINDSDTSDEESDNTVYECPGLAPPGDMKVINPLFSDQEREHSDGSHVSSPTRDFSPPQPLDPSDTLKK